MTSIAQRSVRRSYVWAAAGLLLGVSLGLATAFAAPAPAQKAPNPHWKRDACGQCHKIENGKHLAITPAAADELCLSCHDGRKAAYEFHPIGRAFDGQKYTKPKAWPLVDNRLGCLTCHDMSGGCSPTLEKPGLNRMFLRDFQAGRKQSQPFCRNCHQASAYKKIDPHTMLLPDKNEVIEEKCLFCHSKTMDRKAVARTGDSDLKSAQETLCKDCHPQHKDPMQQGHLGLPITPQMQAGMYAREVIGLSAQLNPAMVAQIQAAGTKPTLMVPDKDGRMTCSTCHNPHQAGVFPRTSVLAYRAMQVSDKGHLVSPVRGKGWCRHCHDL